MDLDRLPPTLRDARRSQRALARSKFKGAKMLIVMGQTGNRTTHKAASAYASSDHQRKMPSTHKDLKEVLSELRDLLEDYAPTWYTEEHHRRVESALHTGKKH